MSEVLNESPYLTYRPVYLLAEFLDGDDLSFVVTFINVCKPSGPYLPAPDNIDVERADSILVWVNGNRSRTPVKGIHTSQAEFFLRTVFQFENMLGKRDC